MTATFEPQVNDFTFEQHRDDYRTFRRILADHPEYLEEANAIRLARRRETRETDGTSVVYFIQAGEHGAIKIGVTRDIKKRMSTLQNGSAETVCLLGTVKGSFKLETDFHQTLHRYRLSGEWFKPCAEVMDFIAGRLAA